MDEPTTVDVIAARTGPGRQLTAAARGQSNDNSACEILAGHDACSWNGRGSCGNWLRHCMRSNVSVPLQPGICFRRAPKCIDVDFAPANWSPLPRHPQGIALHCRILTPSQLTQDLIARASVTPVDSGCQQLMMRAPRGRRISASKSWTSAASRISGRRAAVAGRCCASPATPTWCPPARWRNGAPSRSSPPSSTAGCTAAARPT